MLLLPYLNLEERGNFFAHWISAATKELDNFPVFINEVLAEIPFWCLIASSVNRFVAKPLVERMCIIAFHADFFHHLKSDTVILFTEFTNLGGCTWLLSPEIIRWKTDYRHLASEFFVELLQVLVLRSKATFACHVYNQHFLAFKF